jgi:hypothetical protein
MFLLGSIAFLQITFLPGILALKAFRLKINLLQTLIFSFGLSLIINHLLVLLITAFKLQISIVYYIIFAIEIVLAVLLYRNNWNISLEGGASDIKNNLQTKISRLFPRATNDQPYTLSNFIAEAIRLIFIIWALTSIWWALRVWITNIDTVFTQWDALQSWNKWAVQWYSGIAAQDTWRYSQLIPTNFSVTYAFLRNTQLQFFAKGFMPLFNLYILLILFDQGIETRETGYFIGVVATRYILKKFLGDYISSGYVDVALAFFALVPIWALLKAEVANHKKTTLQFVWLGGILSAGAALTKQNGLLILTAYPILAYILILRKDTETSFKQNLVLLLKIFAASVLLILPWYLYNEYRILIGSNETNVTYLMGDRHGGRDLIERFIRAVGLLEEYAYLYPMIILVLPFLGSTFQWLAITILLPYSLIWTFLFSIFPRNLSMALPYLGLLTGMVGQRLVQMTTELVDRLKFGKLKMGLVVGLVSLLTIIGSVLVPNDKLLQLQHSQQKNILLKSVNQGIYAYFDEIGHYEPIITNYPINYLPGLEEMQIDAGNFKDFDQYIWTIKTHPESSLLLIFEGRADERVLQDIDEKITSGAYELIFKDGKYYLVKIHQR